VGGQIDVIQNKTLVANTQGRLVGVMRGSTSGVGHFDRANRLLIDGREWNRNGISGTRLVPVIWGLGVYLCESLFIMSCRVTDVCRSCRSSGEVLSSWVVVYSVPFPSLPFPSLPFPSLPISHFRVLR